MRFGSDKAENSIMQTISIAVAAILIGVGFSAAPSLINNSRDTATKFDIIAISNAEEQSLSSDWKYQSDVTKLKNLKTMGVTSVITSGGPDCYSVFVKSKSGKIFYRTSTNSATMIAPATWSATPPADYPFPCIAWPATPESATANIAPPISTWSLYGNATYDDASQSVTLARIDSSLLSPLIKINGPLSFSFAIDALRPANVAAHNNLHMGISYLAADGVTPVFNSGGWSSNGDAPAIPTINAWQRMTSGLGAANSTISPTSPMMYIRIAIYASSSYSQPGIQLRTPTLTVVPR